MTRERARELLSLPSNVIAHDIRYHMTRGEINYVTAGWQLMPGYTCFMDALYNLAIGAYPFEDENELHGVRMSELLKRWKDNR